MKKICLAFLLTIQLVSTASLPKKSWLFYTHVDSTNLHPFALYDIDEIKRNYNKDVNSLIFFNGFNSTQKRFSKKLILQSNKTFNEQELSFGKAGSSRESLLEGLRWAISQSSDEFIFLNFWNLKNGILNQTSKSPSKNSISDKDLRYALFEVVRSRNGKKIDVLCQDACLMASIENVIAVADHVKYYVASQHYIAGYGLGYKKILNSLNNIIQPKSFALKIVDSYRENYMQANAEYTLSAVDTSKAIKLAGIVDKISLTLKSMIDEDSDLAIVVRDSLSKTPRYGLNHIDLSCFYQNLINHLENSDLNILITTIDELTYNLKLAIDLINKSVINKTSSEFRAKSMGISIYFPNNLIIPSYSDLHWSNLYPNWLKFLYKYLGYK
ncbi:MAG: clostripain-related cysteine peptidase [Candidatus Babeliales bacterium]|nr:clostripain-related cysteine peptidase [Candidatus Babeliales bacterium]